MSGTDVVSELPPANEDTIRESEERVLRAWPAEGVLRQTGWVIRHDTRSTTRRTRSVYAGPVGDTVNIDVLIDQTETYYRNLGMPPRFQITSVSSPAGLDDVLADRGYVTEAPTGVAWATCQEVGAEDGSAGEVFIREEISDDWADTYRFDLENDTDLIGRCAVIKRIRQPKALAEVRVGDEVVAVGLGVCDGGWTGVFCMYTKEQHRRKGHAQQILSALCQWTMAQGGAYMYLLVEDDNNMSWPLYQKRGFVRVYGYHYRTLLD